MPSEQLLLHIGLHKTGTTWLQNGIFGHERYGFMRIGKKALVDEAFIALNPFRFDAAKASELFEPLLSTASSSGLVPVISHERLSGFDLLGRHDADAIAVRLNTVFPHARVLIAIREQRDLMLSAYKQRIKQWGTETPQKLWREPSDRSARWPVPTLEAYEYHDLIERYQGLFGKDRVLVLLYEQLRDDAAAFVEQICGHVGVRAPAELPTSWENVGIPGALVMTLRYANMVCRALGLAPTNGSPFADNRFELPRRRLIRWLQPRIPRAMSKGVDRRLAEEIEELAGDRFCESNRRTADLTGLDLEAHGFMVKPASSG